MSTILDTFERMPRQDADQAVDALAAMLGALPTDDADPVDRATRAGVEGFVMGYRANRT